MAVGVEGAHKIHFNFNNNYAFFWNYEPVILLSYFSLWGISKTIISKVEKIFTRYETENES